MILWFSSGGENLARILTQDCEQNASKASGCMGAPARNGIRKGVWRELEK